MSVVIESSHQPNSPLSSAAIEELIRKIRLVVFDFDGVFTDNTVIVSEDGKESVRCWRGDGIGLRKIEKVGIKPMILSTEPNKVVAARAKKLCIECVHDCADKKQQLEIIARENSVTLEQICYVGNDINDLECLKAVGFPIVVSDAHPDVLPYARYTTRTAGGYGAVREICDLFARVLASKG